MGAKTSSKISTNKDSFEDLQKFQTSFFTNIKNFESYTHFEHRKYGYILLNNIAKGFPNLADIILNLKGFEWSGTQSPAILKSLQRRFVNNYVQSRVPQFIYFKNNKPTKLPKEKATVSKKRKDLLDFDDEIKQEICGILMFDSKSYEQLKYTDKVQFLGKQLVGEFQQKQKLKNGKTKSSIS